MIGETYVERHRETEGDKEKGNRETYLMLIP